ncbi:U3 small nucleolar RNA-associated protein Utp11 [Chloropicon primus]|uniref:U3 small nucleolar RNA-associated protein 11 n=3 Tax=Chloropicon primus TaxID=1764295 RepID=A0A5B8MGI4_9CHLO|nr:U3 small nucleolar RNA-associated protein Utp11 [Chloropicon primus]UPQ98751.1 U3 small nucleolar RNA-associated protein Utp11 [Chloropicon primus]|eukprot:QDZ19539.1 U3 small nucleolar RNA-associated protein Utp11 [Chloropicon primus]
MSSTYKKAIQGRTHKERSQPSDRKKLGFLEKHKDYVLRARDFHKKEKALEVLREKAEFRNPDEFYFGMQKSKTVGGVHVGDSDPTQYSHEQLMLMKTQDRKYVEMKAQVERKKVEKLQASLHQLRDAPANKHIVFVDNEEDQRQFSPADYFNTSPEYLDSAFHRPTREQLDEDAWTVSSVHEKKKSKLYKELEQRKHRKSELESVALRMDMEKAAMGKGRKRKVRKTSLGGKGIPVYRWKKERKR